MIQIKKLTKSYGVIRAVNGVSFSAQSGMITGLMGPNGCGKSTLIKSILGLVIPDQGEIEVEGVSVRADCAYRHHIGYMPQNPDFPKNLSITELLDMLEDIRGQKAARRKELEALFGLESVGSRSFGVLSGGTKQKVAAVAALMFNPKILILDEPTVGLDPVSAAQFKTVLQDLARSGCCILLVSHLLGEVQSLVQQVVFMLAGQIRFSGTLDEFKLQTSSTTLEQAILRSTAK